MKRSQKRGTKARKYKRTPIPQAEIDNLAASSKAKFRAKIEAGLFDSTLEDMLANGDTAGIRDVLQGAAVLIKAGRPLPGTLRQLIVQALDAIGSGGDANRAFGLKADHRSSATNRLRDVNIAMAAQSLIDQKVTRGEAFEIVRQMLEDRGRNGKKSWQGAGILSVKQIEKIYESRKDKFK